MSTASFNYGAIGAVIGHEISLVFDDKGSQFDGSGNLRDWWTSQGRARFKARTQVLVARYAAFVPLPGYTLNGELTLGENVADNSGLTIGYKVWHLSCVGGLPQACVLIELPIADVLEFPYPRSCCRLVSSACSVT